MNIYRQFNVFIWSLRRTAASLSKEKLSIFRVDMIPAHRAVVWSVYIISLAYPTMTHQLIVEGGENGDFLDFAYPICV